MIPPVLLWLAELLLRVITNARHVTLYIGFGLNNQEWFGGTCEVRVVQIEVDGEWFESKPRRCE
jgi:hypothetical protein